MFNTSNKYLFNTDGIKPTLSDYMTLKFCYKEWLDKSNGFGNKEVVDYLIGNANTIEQLFIYQYGLVFFWRDKSLTDEYTHQLDKLVGRENIKNISADNYDRICALYKDLLVENGAF